MKKNLIRGAVLFGKVLVVAGVITAGTYCFAGVMCAAAAVIGLEVLLPLLD